MFVYSDESKEFNKNLGFKDFLNRHGLNPFHKHNHNLLQEEWLISRSKKKFGWNRYTTEIELCNCGHKGEENFIGKDFLSSDNFNLPRKTIVWYGKIKQKSLTNS